MKIGFSNLAWGIEHDNEVLTMLADYGVTGLEIAPTKVFGDLQNISVRTAREYIHRVEERGLQVIAFQAFLFGHPELRLFDDQRRPEMIDFIKRVLELAGECGVDRLIYGAPKSRQRMGRSYGECEDIARIVFAEIGRFAKDCGVVFCLEPNPRFYGCDFTFTAEQGSKLVRDVNSTGFRLHLDSACMSLAGDDLRESIIKNADILSHFHISEPNLADFSEPKIDHGLIAETLKEVGYSGWVSVEMKPALNEIAGVKTALEYIKREYKD